MSIFKQLSQKLQHKIQAKGHVRVTKAPQSTQFQQKQIDQLLNQARAEARDIIINAKDQALEIKTRTEQHANITQNRLFKRQDEIMLKQTQLVKTQAALTAREQFLETQKQSVRDKAAQIQKVDQEYLEKLLDLANLSQDQAQQNLKTHLQKRLDEDKAFTIQVAQNQAQEDTEAIMNEVLTTTMSRGATNFYNEYMPPIVWVRNQTAMDEIRGANDCNKEFFEQLAKVELVIDELKIKINSIDSVDREIARQTLEKVVENRRINPALIRRIYHQVKKQTEDIMFKSGKKLCHRVGVYNLPDDMVAKLGKFTYRHSYGQNMIEHTLEETLIGIALAYEFGADSNIVRLGCLFHDIGKVIYDDEGTHVETGVAYLKEHNIPQAVIDCVAQSHEDEPFSSIESIIVHIADSISGARPAARHNDHEFANRIKYLETTPLEYPGVKEAYAIQAGREVRIIVDPKKLSDEDIQALAVQLRDRIKKELTYPGSVTVNVVREISTSSTIHLEAPQKN